MDFCSGFHLALLHTEMVIRITNKLSKRIKVKPSSELLEADNAFVDWAADHFTVNGRRYIVITNCASILTWVYHAKGVNSADAFIESSTKAIQECLLQNGFELHWEQIVKHSLDEVRFRKMGNRNMTGILMDLVRNAIFYIGNFGEPVQLVSARLSKIPQLSRSEPNSLRAFRALELPNR